MDATQPKPRGFAAMSPERRREIARKGGAAVPDDKRPFADRELAKSAGLKGGAAIRARYPKCGRFSGV